MLKLMQKKRFCVLFVSIFILCWYCIFSTRKFVNHNSANYLEREIKHKEYLNISIIIVVGNLKSIEEDYSISIPTVQRYAQINKYPLLIIDFSNKTRFPSECDLKCEYCSTKLKNSAPVKFARHCIISDYLNNNPEIDYVLALDADTGVINPNHRIEDYIDPTFDLTFHERRYNYEIQAATYIAKNSEYTKFFLNKWTNLIYQIPVTIVNADNPALHQLLMEENHVDDQKQNECKALWKYADGYYDIKKFIYCTRLFLGFNSTTCCDSKIRFYLSTDLNKPSWSRDGWLSESKFSDGDFMFHDWKTKDLKGKARSHWINPFSNNSFHSTNFSVNIQQEQWKYKPGFYLNQTALNKLLIEEQTKWRKKYEPKYLKNIRDRISKNSIIKFLND